MEPKTQQSSPETLYFRLLCPASKIGNLIGKGGSGIRHIRELTGARVRVDDHSGFNDERVIMILSDSPPPPRPKHSDYDHQEEPSTATTDGEGPTTPAQQALLGVFERMVWLDQDDRGDDNKESHSQGSQENTGNNGNGMVMCRLMAPSSLVGCVLGRGGKIVEKIRQDSGAQIRVLTRDQIPLCASPNDELIQITGNFLAVKKALLSVSGCLQDNRWADVVNCATTKISGGLHHGTGPENVGAGRIVVMEEEVVFKLMCQSDKVGSLIGKGGSVIRTIQNETGASIKVVDGASNSDERVVIISARENSEQKYSPAQEAVIRVQSRIAEIGFEPGTAVVARLLVHSQQIGCLLGKGGFIISEMRRATGASIRIFPKEHISKGGSQNDEVVQVIGSFPCVQDALFHITSRLRETIFPMRSLHPNYNAPTYMSPYPEMPPHFGPRYGPASPGSYHSVGLHHGIDCSAVPSQSLEHAPRFLHPMDHNVLPQNDRSYPYGSERLGQGPTFENPPSPRMWNPQGVNSGNPRGRDDIGPCFASGNRPLASTNIEIMIPQTLLSHVYGENNNNLDQIRKISGAKVVVHDYKPGALEGQVTVCGNPDQMRTAQTLIHAFILCGQTATV